MSLLALLAALVLGQAEPAPDTGGWKQVLAMDGLVMRVDPGLLARDGQLRRFRGRLDNPAEDAFVIFEAHADCSAVSIAMVGGKVYEHGVFKSEKKAGPGDTLVMTEADSPGVGEALKYICGL